MTTDVIIVGAGISGLATAYELSRRGVSFVILERGPRAGGVVLNEHVDGFTIDAGPDAVLTQKPEAIALCRELGLGDRLTPTRPPRVAYIQREGRLHPLPAASVLGIPTAIRPFLATRLFSWPGKLRMAGELFVPARRDGADESIAHFVGRRFGDEAVTYLAEPLLAGIHAGDVDRLSIRALFPRLVQAEEQHGSLLRAFHRVRRPQGAHESAFVSLPGGLSELVQALVHSLPVGALRAASPVTRVATVGTAFQVRTAREACDARSVVLSTPAFVTSALIQSVDPALAQLCAEIPYASAATVALGFEQTAIGHPLNGSGFVVPRVERSGILAASWLSSKWPHRAPEGRVLLRTFIGGARDPDALRHSDEELVDRSLRALTPLLAIRGGPLLTRVYRFERANAQHEVGHLARLDAIESRLALHPGLFVTGSGFRGTGIPDCVADGRATARSVAAFLAKGFTTEITEETRRGR